MDIFTTALSLITSADATLWGIVGLSFKISGAATLLAALLAVPLGAALAMGRFWGRRGILALSTALMALPPVVVGLAIYLLLSRAGPLGHWGLLFTPSAMIIAQTVLIFPIILALTTEAVTPLEQSYRPLLDSVDAGWVFRLKTLIIDARFAIFTALLAGFGRAIAEVGAVIIVGGNIAGLTRVMTTTIALETSKGNLELALALGIVLILMALAVNAIIHLLKSAGEKNQRAQR
ncbi:ABC transporter permease [Amylibacter marinus]|uniref:ABC transporter permease n=1 Tax=Amylibacter marinus TaxID=1475483 RepID=A0ABQ5VT49_9RHOB|nr:ABC transporter permease [Amylibacter marinus]GLQ34546.1 ABC transporter permease [Amylibacter marinus]